MGLEKYWQQYKAAKAKKKEKKKGVVREWVDALLFAVVAATIVRWMIFTPYTIPTSSMEKSLLVGDFLIVSKLHYGPKTPETPLQLPLMSNYIWGTRIPSYISWPSLPVFRFPGFTDVKNNDVVVFHAPVPEDLQFPSDQRTPYIKRCIGIAGDTIAIENKEVLVNGDPFPVPPLMQTSYNIETKSTVRERTFLENDITDVTQTQNGYNVKTNAETAQSLESKPFVSKVTEEVSKPGEHEYQIYPGSQDFPWNRDNFGPLVIPAEGMTIPVTERNMELYEKVIIHLERNDDVRIQDGQLWIDGEQLNEYTFKQDYFFMMGDNRHNSLDSRYWGFVPEDHIIGKAIFTWWSVNKNESWLNPGKKIRWNKIFKSID